MRFFPRDEEEPRFLIFGRYLSWAFAMLAEVVKYLGKMPKRRRRIAFALVLSGIFFPLALAFWALSTHNAFDNILDYEPLRNLFALLGLASLLVFITAFADLVLRVRRKDRKFDFPSVPTTLVASLSILAAIAVAAYVGLPQLLRSGDVAPQIIMTESAAGNGMPGIAVVFYTEKPIVNALEWGVAGSARQILTEGQPANQHWFQLAGLEPDTLYEYSLNGGEVAEFRTPPGPGEELRFAASGDSHFGAAASRNDMTRAMAEDIRDGNYSMFFLLGDSVQYGFSDSMWKEAFNSLSPVSSSIPTGYVLGNHDAMFGGAELYKNYLCPPGITDAQRQCLTKRIDNGNVHFLILDVEWELQTYTGEQKDWLVRQLSAIPRDDWCIVMSHTFYYSSGSYMDGWAWYDNPSTIRELTPLFENHSVDLVLSGHKHHSEVLQKDGVTYVVLGAFGGVPDPEREYVSPASLWYRQGAYAFADVTIQNKTATIRILNSNKTELYRTDVRQRT